MSYYSKAYQAQRSHMDEDLEKDGRKAVHDAWFREGTIDHWRHNRMYRTVEDIAYHYRDGRWLTVGDGRYGLDAVRLKQLFGLNVFPTDISSKLLEKSKQQGLLSEYGVENAESLSFADESFDVIVCKEALHHCPRPIIALYEMMRVAKEAVILIEPNDSLSVGNPKRLLRQCLGMFRGLVSLESIPQNRRARLITDPSIGYEPSGNFVYSVSTRELIKIAHASNLGQIAWKGFCDHFVEGCESELADESNPVFTKIRNRINSSERRCRQLSFFYDWRLKTFILFKREISHTLKNAMKNNGFRFAKMKPNPYMK